MKIFAIFAVISLAFLIGFAFHAKSGADLQDSFESAQCTVGAISATMRNCSVLTNCQCSECANSPFCGALGEDGFCCTTSSCCVTEICVDRCCRRVCDRDRCRTECSRFRCCRHECLQSGRRQCLKRFGVCVDFEILYVHNETEKIVKKTCTHDQNCVEKTFEQFAVNTTHKCYLKNNEIFLGTSGKDKEKVGIVFSVLGGIAFVVVIGWMCYLKREKDEKLYAGEPCYTGEQSDF